MNQKEFRRKIHKDTEYTIRTFSTAKDLAYLEKDGKQLGIIRVSPTF